MRLCAEEAPSGLAGAVGSHEFPGDAWWILILADSALVGRLLL